MKSIGNFEFEVTIVMIPRLTDSDRPTLIKGVKTVLTDLKVPVTSGPTIVDVEDGVAEYNK